MRKRVIAVALTLGILAAAVVGGTALASGGGGNGNGSRIGGLIARVATILGIEEQQVQDAFDQARREIQDERLEQKLDKLVENGYLTQEQADQLREWYQARPDGVYPGFGSGGLSPRLGGHFGFGGPRFFRGGGHHRFFSRSCVNGECTNRRSLPAPDTDDTSL